MCDKCREENAFIKIDDKTILEVTYDRYEYDAINDEQLVPMRVVGLYISKGSLEERRIFI